MVDTGKKFRLNIANIGLGAQKGQRDFSLCAFFVDVGFFFKSRNEQTEG